MRPFNSAVAVCCVTLLMASDAGAIGELTPVPGCKKRWSEIAELEASLKGEQKIPYDAKAPRLGHCRVTQPLVSDDLRRERKTSIAIVVFDVTGSGRVIEQQLIGQKSLWSEIAQKEVATWLFEPLVEDGVGITRVGVTVALVVEFEGRGQSCGNAQSPVMPGIDFSVHVCANLRY